MKTLYSLTLLVLYASFAFAANEVPNPGFENWTSGSPTGWYAGNIPGYGIPVTQSGTAHSGSYAVKGQPVIVTGGTGDTLPPVLYSGTPGTTFPITQSYGTLEFYYQCNLTGGDLFSAVVVYYSGTTPIGGGNIDYSANASGWAHASIPISFTGTPTGASISFTLLAPTAGTRNYANPASYFLVDDVALTDDVGVDERTAVSKLQVFPMPAHDRLTIKAEAMGGNATLQLMDITGRVVINKSLVQHTSDLLRYDVDLNGILPGRYLLLVTNEEKRLVRNIVVY